MQALDKRYSLITSTLMRLAKALIIAFSVVMVVVTLAQVVFRYVVAAPLPWSEELARYCFVWIVFLGGAIGLARGVHLGVDLLVEMLPARLRFALELVVNALIAAFAVAVIYASTPVLSINMMQRSPALGVQMSWIYLAIPVSMGLIAIIAAERIVTGLRAGPRMEG